MRIIGIDPATVTGFVVLDMKGRVLVEEHVTGTKGGSKEYQMATLMFEIKDRLRPGDVVGIESFALEATDTNKVSSGNNWASRIATAMVCKALYVTPGPGQIKKFLGVEEWSGTKKVKGDPTTGKTKKKPKDVKKEVKSAAEKRFNYPGLISDNTADAMTIAHITRYVFLHRTGQFDITTLPENEYEAVLAVHDKGEFDKYLEAKKLNEQRRKAEERARKREENKKTGRGKKDNGSGSKDAGGIEQPDLFGGVF